MKTRAVLHGVVRDGATPLKILDRIVEVAGHPVWIERARESPGLNIAVSPCIRAEIMLASESEHGAEYCVAVEYEKHQRECVETAEKLVKALEELGFKVVRRENTE